MWNANLEGIKESIGSFINQSNGPDAVKMLESDHRRFKNNFEAFETEQPEEKKRLFKETLLALKLHSQIELELVYPIIRRADDKIVDESVVEHHVVDLVIAELEGKDPSDPKVEAKFKVLGELVKHHIKEEEGQALPKLKEESVDLEVLGRQMEQRKHDLMGQITLRPARKATARSSKATKSVAGRKSTTAASRKSGGKSTSAKRSAAGRKGAAVRRSKSAAKSSGTGSRKGTTTSAATRRQKQQAGAKGGRSRSSSSRSSSGRRGPASSPSSRAAKNRAAKSK